MKMSQIVEEACLEATIYQDAGVVSCIWCVTLGVSSSTFVVVTTACTPFFQDGVIIENMHDIPYSLSVGPEVVACMTAVCTAVRSVCPSLPLGVQILSAANQQALAVALASGTVCTSLLLSCT